MERNNNIDTTAIEKLDLLNKASKMDYVNYTKNVVQSDVMISQAENILDSVFRQDKNDIGKAILMSYAFSTYSNDIFRPYKTGSDHKLIHYSNKLIKYLSSIIKGKEVDDDFYLTVNKYYSLFTIWQSKEKIKEITKINQVLMDTVESNNIMRKMGMNTDDIAINDEIKNTYNKMININRPYTVGIIVRTYNIYKPYNDFINYFWRDVSELDPINFWDILYVIIVDMRAKLSSDALTIEMRKKLYYSIDIDELAKKIYIRKKILSKYDILFICNIFCEYLALINKVPPPLDDINKITDKNINSIEYQHAIVNFLHKLLNEIY